MSNPSRLPGCQWSSYISKVGPLHNWTSVLTMQGIPDQSHCELNAVARGGGHGPLGLIILSSLNFLVRIPNHKAANLAILSYKIDLHTTVKPLYSEQSQDPKKCSLIRGCSPKRGEICSCRHVPELQCTNIKTVSSLLN